MQGLHVTDGVPVPQELKPGDRQLPLRGARAGTAAPAEAPLPDLEATEARCCRKSGCEPHAR